MLAAVVVTNLQLEFFVQQQAEELSCLLNMILLIFRLGVGLATVINRE